MIIIVKTKLLYSKYKGLLNKISKLMLDNCNFTLDICPYTYNNCNSYIYFYIDERPYIGFNNIEQILEQINIDDVPVLGALLAMEGNIGHFTDVYNVCTHKQYRNKGIMKEIFYRLIEDLINIWGIDNFNLWVGLITDQPKEQWESLLKMYTKLGFTNPYLTRNTPSFFSALPFTVIGLNWDKTVFNYFYNNIQNKQIEDKIKKQLMIANILRQSYYKEKDNCNLKLYFNLEICENLKKYLSKNVEVAGELLLSKYYYNNNILYKNIVFKDNIILGSQEGFFVNIPNKIITFHTHPHICYIKEGCYIGWPSGYDLILLVDNFPNMLKHYVITVEGIYSLQLAIDTQLKLFSKKIDKEKFSDMLYKKMSSFEQLRSEVYKTEKNRHHNMHDFFKTISTITYSKLLEGNGEYSEDQDNNFLIYYITFYSWNMIYSNKGFEDNFITINKICPIIFS